MNQQKENIIFHYIIKTITTNNQEEQFKKDSMLKNKMTHQMQELLFLAPQQIRQLQAQGMHQGVSCQCLKTQKFGTVSAHQSMELMHNNSLVT